MKSKGWTFEDYSFEELYDAYLTVVFEYKGKEYRLSCESDQCLYDMKTGKKVWSFTSKEDFYNGIVFDRPIKDVIDDSHMMSLL